MDLIILLLVTFLVLLLCDKNNSPNFLSKILYNSDFNEKSDEVEVKEKSAKEKSKTPTSDEVLESNLDLSSEDELSDFDASSEADDLIKEITGIS